MGFDELVAAVGEEPVFETGLLLVGAADPKNVHRQLSRWTRTGRIHQLRRGLYTLAPPFQRRSPHPFLVANHLVPGSYVSGPSALAFAHVIPEYVPEVTSVTGGRPHHRALARDRFSFRHLKADLMFGYRQEDLGSGQRAYVATPEKALLDAVHLQPGGDDEDYLRELRLNFEALNVDGFDQLVRRCETPKLSRAAQRIRSLADEEEPYRTL